MASDQNSGQSLAVALGHINTPETTQVTSKLEILPIELQRAILEYVSRRDVLNLAQVRAMSYAARLNIYTSVSLRLAQHEGFIQDVNRFMSAGSRNMSLVQNLSILNSKRRRILGVCSIGAPYRFGRSGEWRQKRLFTEYSILFNRMMRILFSNTSGLRTVRWFHLFKMDNDTFASLFNTHVDTLMGIETYTLTGDEIPILPGHPSLDQFPRLRIGFSAFQASGCNKILNPSVISLIARLTRRLSHFVLGDERLVLIVDSNATTRSNPPYIQMSLHEVLQPLAEAQVTFGNLSQLDIIGIDMTPLQNQLAPLRPTFDLYNLRRLSLVSCVGTEGLLNVLSMPAPHMMSPYVFSRMRLKEFCIRYEGPTLGLKIALVRFLTSFTGLELLSVLLDDEPENTMIDHTGFMYAHGPTLKVLVWEVRKQNRHERPFGLEDDIRGKPAFLELLSQTCPNLQELSVVLNMRLLYVRGRGFDRIHSRRPYAMLRLPHLKTLHCRDFLMPKGRLLTTAFVIDATKSIATMFLDWAFHFHRFASPLELLAVGPLTFHDRWIQNHYSQDYSANPADGLIFYDVRTCPNNLMGIAHQLNPLLTTRGPYASIELDDVEMVRQHYKHTRVFDSYWLK
ncbi:predicted protein [Histoplasma capsulatum var. duboisii H88]|uniref:Predicted protein n=1 Tax=Ajellomyces capsulatus (strain H88) TaxID=544711 RepID=F0UR15_AJEC8|nr:predicted protein [Histoplasma capsulatum var. duboisii H88]QSS50366.1 hypothetical protein I7I53_11030 [Histoplasma capsulatum var. duboisii H88]